VDISNGAFSLDWETVASSGFVVGVLFLALVERLRRTFATKQDLNGLGQKFNALENLYIQVRDAVDEARDHTIEVRAEQRAQAERIDEGVIATLIRLTEKVDQLAEGLAGQRAAVEHIGRRLDRVEECLDSRLPPTRRRL